MYLDAMGIACLDVEIAAQSDGKYDTDDIQNIEVLDVPGQDTRDGFPRRHIVANLPKGFVFLASFDATSGRQAAIVRAHELADAIRTQVKGEPITYSQEK